MKRRHAAAERLEPRCLLAADPIHVGIVYLETDYLESDQDVGGDSRGDRFIVSFVGGAPDTQLRQLRIRTDKDADGISVGDPIFDTELGGRGKAGAGGFQIVRVQSASGQPIQATAEVDDGGQELILRLSDFRAGDRLEFTIDVDEVLRNAIDLAIFNDRLDVITSGQEFQDSVMQATFEAPHYQDTVADAVFVNDYGDPGATTSLNIPPDDGEHHDSRPDRSAAAIASADQQPEPVEISGHVWIDNNLNTKREPQESMIDGVVVALWQRQADGTFRDTGHRATTDSRGEYRFSAELGLNPGVYRVVEQQPSGFFSVGAVAGKTVYQGVPANDSVGSVESADAVTDIELPLGGLAAVDYDFAEAQPAGISGYVYGDQNRDGVRQNQELGIAGVRIQLIPINTVAPQSPLTATTDSDGSYRFTGLAPGRYEVVEVDQPLDFDDGLDAAGIVDQQVVGIADNPGDRIHNIDLASGELGIEYNFGELPRGSIAGFVYLAAPGEDCTGDHDAPGNTPLPGVQLALQNERGETVARTRTSVDGDYRFENLPWGEYRVIEFTPNGFFDGQSHVGMIDGVSVGDAIDGGRIDHIMLEPGVHAVDYNFCESAAVAVSGYVYHDTNDDGHRDSTESPIANVAIRLRDANGNEVAVTRSDIEGFYTFDDLPPGEYSIEESQPDGFLDGIDTPGTILGRSVGRASGGDTIDEIVLPQGTRGIEYNFGERRTASISGRVHADLDDDCRWDPGERTLQGVEIRLLDASGREVARTITDASGQYLFDDITPGTYSIIEKQPTDVFDGDAKSGSVGGDVLNSNQIVNIVLASGDRATGYDFCEKEPAEISGNVFSDPNGDCRFDADERGIAGTRIELYDDQGSLIAVTTTDGDGSYRFTGLRAGSYTVVEIQPSGWLHGGQRAGDGGGDDSIDDTIAGISLGWGQRLTQYNLCELPPASIGGLVFVDNNGDCIHDPSETSIEGVAIELRDANGVLIATTLTDARGRYLFDGLRPGQYELFERQPDGFFEGDASVDGLDAVALTENLVQLTLLSNQHLVDINFCEQAPVSLQGHVWEEGHPNGQFDPDDVPLPGVLIELVDASDQVIQTTRTDIAGMYQFIDLAPGTYGVREIQPDGYFHGGQVIGNAGGQVRDDDFLVGITLASGESGEGYDFPEVPPASISGFVYQDGGPLVLPEIPDPKQLRLYRDGLRSPDDVPLAGVQLELRNILGLPFDSSRALPGTYPDGPIQTTTDENGFYEFTGLRPGTYHVYEVQPSDLIDGLDTPGTTGGIAVNPADPIDDDSQILVQTLALSELTDPRNDGILNITLRGGDQSVDNNFSEIIVAPPQLPLPAPSQTTPQFVPQSLSQSSLRAPRAGATFSLPPVPPVRLVTYIPPFTNQSISDAVAQWSVSWHLSVINGGMSPGQSIPSAAIIRTAAAKSIDHRWIDPERNSGRWTTTRNDWRQEPSDPIILGKKGATALSGDFNGDGKDEAVIFIGGQWFVDLNGNGRWDTGDLWIQLGTELDRPVIGDWDGDGKDDVGIFGRQWQRDPHRIVSDPGLPDPDNVRRRRATAKVNPRMPDEGRGEDRPRLLKRATDGPLRADAVDHVFQYGEQVDTPVSGDWNGDGIDQIAIFRNGHWLLDTDGDGRATAQDPSAVFGRPGDEPIVGDFNGDGIDDIGVVRGDLWIIDTDGDRRITGNDLQIVVPRSNEDSQPVVGDFDGDGKDEPGYYDDEAA